MTKVLVLTNDFPPRRGGIESFVAALCDRLPADDVVVYTAAMPAAREHDATLAFPVHRDPAATLLPTPMLARRVVEVMRCQGCDRVVFGAAAPLGLLAPRLRAAGAQRMVALTHGHEVWWATLPGFRSALRRIGDEVDVLTYVSEWCRRRIEPALSPAGRGRLRRLSPGVDPALFRPGCGGVAVRVRLGIAPTSPVVVCTSRLVRRKGQDRLLQAWPEVLQAVPGAVLLLVGDGPQRGRLARSAHRLGVEGSVVMAGSVPWAAVPAWTDAGDVLAMPSRTRRLGLEPEAWGIVSLEGQACGLPVVLGRSGGVPETVATGSRSWVVEDHRGLARALVAAVREASTAGQDRRDRVGRAPWTWEAAVDRLRDLLEVG